MTEFYIVIFHGVRQIFIYLQFENSSILKLANDNQKIIYMEIIYKVRR